ncbi:MAG: N-acetylmuramoyl-L-alanine amidase, partial [Oscillospiraceae bacterium]|nr:N-acetylmuramoyl-L-alanine amidase [Oscillospiraceae bacterium]
GGEAYYFTPFSQPLAKYISEALGDVLTQVHGSSSGANRGEKYNYFFVTQQQDFPSVLVETAFVTNYSEAMALADPAYQKKFASAIVSGMKKYFARTNYSCFGDGSATWNDTGGSASDSGTQSDSDDTSQSGFDFSSVDAYVPSEDDEELY